MGWFSPLRLWRKWDLIRKGRCSLAGQLKLEWPLLKWGDLSFVSEDCVSTKPGVGEILMSSINFPKPAILILPSSKINIAFSYPATLGKRSLQTIAARKYFSGLHTKTVITCGTTKWTEDKNPWIHTEQHFRSPSYVFTPLGHMGHPSVTTLSFGFMVTSPMGKRKNGLMGLLSTGSF